jgi:hypothetical protein
MTTPLPEGQGLWYAPIGRDAEAVASALTPYIPGRGILVRSERRRVAAAVILGALAAMPTEGTPAERLATYLSAPGRSAEARAVMLAAAGWARMEHPGTDFLEPLQGLATLLAPAPHPVPLYLRK